MKNYSIKIALRDVSPMIWRRLRVSGHTSLANLHHMIQIVFGWEDDYLHLYHIYGKDYGIAYAGGLSFSDDPHTVSLDDFDFDVGDRFTYEYNFYEHWLHDIRIEAIENDRTLPVATYCVKGNGMPGANKYDEYERTMDLLKAIVNAGQSATIEDIRCQIEALNAVWFNRKRVNHRLANLSV